MNAEVISIGDELTSGQRLDTNSQWLSLQLADLGIRTLFHTTVADDLAANVEVFRHAAARADVVISTGGLGPTADDLTRQSIADMAGVSLVLDEGSLAHIQRLFAHRKREMPPANRVQAMFPVGSRVIPNPHGTAPGIDFDTRTQQRASRIFAFPGVPAEMREMWNGYVRPQLIEMLGPERRIIRHRVIRCFGVGESDLEQMLPDLIRRGRVPQVGITVSQATISLRITAEASSDAACNELIEPTVAIIRQSLGSLVFGEEEDELQHAVVRLLQSRGETLSVVEWGTQGGISQWLAEQDAEGRSFVGGYVSRGWSALPGRERQSTPPPADAAREELVRAATVCRDRFQTTYALVVGPTPPLVKRGETPGEIFVALASPAGTIQQAFTYAGHPDILLHRTAKQALNLLRLEMLSAERK